MKIVLKEKRKSEVILLAVVFHFPWGRAERYGYRVIVYEQN
jgi:hypothetical protein